MINFIVSGQPKLGHESWPPPVDDKVLSDRLYGQRGAKENTRMEVKFEKVGDRLITYYHFSKLKDVTSCLTEEEKKMNPQPDHGRPGSFFVMSLRIDGYYSSDFSNIFSLLEEMYKNHVNGKILKMSKKGYLVYQIMKLEEAKEIWKNITSELESRSENTFLKRIKPIPSDISIKGTLSSDYFSVEDTEKGIERVLIQKGGVIVLSANEMNARNGRINQQNIKSVENNHYVERIIQHESDTIVKEAEDIQEQVSVTDNIQSKIMSLSEEQEIDNERTDGVGGSFQISSQKRGFVKRFWLPIALIVLGLIDFWLSISVVNMKEKVDALVEQIDTLAVKRGSSTIEINAAPKSENKGTEEKREGVPSVNSNAEAAEITLLDLRKADGSDVSGSGLLKGNSYVIIAKTGERYHRYEANGTGSYSCNVGVDKGVNWRQDGNKCHITIYEDATAKKVTLTYKYHLDNKEKSFQKEIYIR